VTAGLPTLTVGTARAVQLPLFTDARGLALVRRDGRARAVRAAALLRDLGRAGRRHARRPRAPVLHQFIVCLQGACTLRLSDGHATDTLSLASPALGVHARR
jgi:hypothetical protein